MLKTLNAPNVLIGNKSWCIALKLVIILQK